ncbi:putative nucleotidyltransferase, Ribonuclease H [Helianthus annuus]|nr:putative nucleotidyltransferase, Ribonuclease H [Helianthus annuus]
MTSPKSIYIPIGITYKDYKAEYFAAYIDSGSGLCICKPDCFPKDYHEDLTPCNGVRFLKTTDPLKRGIKNPIIIIGSYMVKCPPFYFYNSGSDVLLGNDFLERFNKITFDIVAYQIILKTPCHHLIVVKRIKNAYGRKFPINFTTRASQRGDIGYKQNPKLEKWIPVLEYYLKEPLDYQVNLRKLDNHIENIKDKLKQCYTSNPLQFWDKNKITTKLEMKDKDKEISVKPMRYNPEDQKEFRSQIKELLDPKLIRASHSPHSSPVFLVRKHAEVTRGKPRMVINYKKLNDNTLFNGYFLPHKESLINSTRSKKIFSKFDCKSGF